MKKILFSALLLASLSGKSQEIHYDSAAHYSYVNVAKTIDETVIQRRLCVRLVNDNLSDEAGEAILYYEVRDYSEPQNVIMTGNLFIRGIDYENWDGGNDYCYDFVAETLYFKIED